MNFPTPRLCRVSRPNRQTKHGTAGRPSFTGRKLREDRSIWFWLTAREEKRCVGVRIFQLGRIARITFPPRSIRFTVRFERNELEDDARAEFAGMCAKRGLDADRKIACNCLLVGRFFVQMVETMDRVTINRIRETVGLFVIEYKGNKDDLIRDFESFEDSIRLYYLCGVYLKAWIWRG